MEFISILHNYHYVLSPLFWECPHLHLSFGTRELTNKTPTSSKYATKYPPFGKEGDWEHMCKKTSPTFGGKEGDWEHICKTTSPAFGGKEGDWKHICKTTSPAFGGKEEDWSQHM
jgi:hypothetical protein